MTHQENDFSFFDFFTKDGIFVNWINEVHADFGGTEKAFNGERKKAICGMKYKLSCKQKKDKDTIKFREKINKLVEKNRINDARIKKISLDTYVKGAVKKFNEKRSNRKC